MIERKRCVIQGGIKVRYMKTVMGRYNDEDERGRKTKGYSRLFRNDIF